MAVDHSFIAFCSAVLNSKTAQKQFNDPQKQKELFKKYELSGAQIKAVRSKDVDAITLQIKKEITTAIKKDPSVMAIGW